MVDAQNNIWLVGNSGICSSPYDLTDCSLSAQAEPQLQHFCQKLYYAEGFLLVDGCTFDPVHMPYKLYNTVGQLFKSGEISGQSCFIGTLQKGVYFVEMQLSGGIRQLAKLYVD